MNALRTLRFYKVVSASSGPQERLIRFYCKGTKESKKCSDLKAQSLCQKENPDKGKDKSGGQSKERAEKGSKKDGKDGLKKITMIPGEGVGPELMESLMTVCEAAKAPVEWETIRDIKVPGTEKVSPELLDSLKCNKVGIKGPVMSNLWMKDLRKSFELFAYTAVCRNMEGQDNPYGNINCVIIRDMMEGAYSGIEHSVVPGVMQSIKVSTAAGAKRLAKYVFLYCKEFDRKKVTVAHKANIMRLTDGNFLKHMRAEASKNKAERQFEERYMDTACLNLIMKPETCDVLVSSSMYGDVLVMMASSITGSKAMCPGYAASPHGRLYDTLNKVRFDIAGKDMINPTGMLFSGVLMLRRLKLFKEALKISCAIKSVYKDTDLRTNDIGGCAKCSEFTKAVCGFI
ncbi:hypothetical protein KR222_000917, partial [Zaprionus bogoriensis]